MHILDGDGDGERGGHRWDSEIPGKTKFPYEWDDDQIVDRISDVAKNPDNPPLARPRGGGWVCTGTREGVGIEVITNSDGAVWTRYPTGGPGITANPDQ